MSRPTISCGGRSRTRAPCEVCLDHKVGILAYSPLGQGLFTGKIRSEADIPKREGDIRHRTVLFQGEAFQAGLAMVKNLDALSAKYGKTPAQIAAQLGGQPERHHRRHRGQQDGEAARRQPRGPGVGDGQADDEFLRKEGSRSAKLFDYSSSLFGMKYDGVKIDDMIDSSL